MRDTLLEQATPLRTEAGRTYFSTFTANQHWDNQDAGYECESGVDRCDICAQEHDDLIAIEAEAINAYEPLVKALQGIVDEPYGCAFCDYGVLRNPTKEHADDCSWVAARAALATVESSPEREGGE